MQLTITANTSGASRTGSVVIAGQILTVTQAGGGGTPAAVLVTPNSGSTASQTFVLQYSDTAGATSLQSVWVWFAASGSTANSCLLTYSVGANQMNLLNDADTSWSTATVEQPRPCRTANVR